VFFLRVHNNTNGSISCNIPQTWTIIDLSFMVLPCWRPRRRLRGGGHGGGCARRFTGTHLHIPVVVDGNPVLVPNLVRLGVGSGSDSAIREISNHRQAPVHRAILNDIYIPSLRSSARAVLYFFSRQHTPRML
jgi:hypothetical protein